MDLYPVTYTLTGLSLFENEEYDVLKCSVDSESLHALNKQARELEHTNNYPDYIPHLTIAYLNPGEGKKYLKMKSPIFDKELKSDRFIFSDKDGNQTKWKVEG
jgi:2'-5' RNA ligase